MRIGIVETGRPMDPMRAVHGDYPSMFARLLGRAAPELEFHGVAVLDGELPDDPTTCDGWLITGSVHGVYEDHAWIAPLTAFCRACADAGRPLVGICFGHQLIAEAFGGSAAKSDRGWGAGVHTYTVYARRPWMVEPLSEMAVVVSHQDQVTALPPGAVLLGGSAFCPHGLFTLGEHVMAMQCHPEMSNHFSAELIELRRERMGASTSDAARASLETPIDSDTVGRWIAAFLQGVR